MKALLPSLEMNEEVLDQEWMGEFPLDNSWQQKKSDSYFSTSRNIRREQFFKEFSEFICAFFFNINLFETGFFFILQQFFQHL